MKSSIESSTFVPRRLSNYDGLFWTDKTRVSVTASTTWTGKVMYKIVFASILNEANRKARLANRSVIAIA